MVVNADEMFAEFFALRVGPLIALGARPCGQQNTGGRLLVLRLLAFHAVTLPALRRSFNPCSVLRKISQYVRYTPYELNFLSFARFAGMLGT